MAKRIYDTKVDPRTTPITGTAVIPADYYKDLEQQALSAGVPVRTMLSAIMQMGLMTWNATSPGEQKRVLRTLLAMSSKSAKGDSLAYCWN